MNKQWVWAVLAVYQLTQEQLAERAGINPKHLSDIELGKYNVSIAYLCKIADALGISYWELLNGQ